MNNTLSSVTENFMTDGIFTYLVNSTAWTAPFSNAIELNLQYYGNISGDKPISPLVNKLLGDNETLSVANMTSLANVLIAMYGKKWNKLWDTTQLDYNPIENYSMVEAENINDNTVSSRKTTYNTTIKDVGSDQLTNDLTQTLTNKLTDTKTLNLANSHEVDLTDKRTDDLNHLTTNNLTDKLTNDLTDTTTKTGTVGTVDHSGTVNTPNTTTTENTFGFNSSSAVPATTTSRTGTENSTTDTTNTITNNTTDTLKRTGTETTLKTGTETVADTGDVTTTRTGSETITDTGTETYAKTGTETTANTGTSTTAKTNTNTHTGADEVAGSDDKTVGRTLKRNGNIGVTTSQQMLQAERDVWMWNYFTDALFPDINSVLTLSIYE